MASISSAWEARFGGLAIGRVLEKTSTVSAEEWFPAFDAGALEPHMHWLHPDHFDADSGRFPLPIQSYVLKTSDHVIVIDTCTGNEKNRPGFAGAHMLQTPYLDRLAGLGVAPADVDFVLCTHLHLDHVGWNTRLHEAHWLPTFPNARYVMGKLEYETVKQEASREGVDPYIRNCFVDSVLPVVQADRAMFVDDGAELLEGILFRVAPGHSPGHMWIEVQAGQQLIVFSGDILHSAVQVARWEWSTVACWDPQQAAASRRRLLERCIEADAILVPTHFVAPHAGRIRERDDGFGIDFGFAAVG